MAAAGAPVGRGRERILQHPQGGGALLVQAADGQAEPAQGDVGAGGDGDHPAVQRVSREAFGL